MKFYNKSKLKKHLLPLVILLLVAYTLFFTLETNFTYNENNSNPLVFQTASKSNPIIISNKTNQNNIEIIQQSMASALAILSLLFQYLIIKLRKSSYEYINLSRLYIKLSRLLIPKFHMSKYKDLSIRFDVLH